MRAAHREVLLRLRLRAREEALPALRDNNCRFCTCRSWTNRPDQRTRIPSDSAQVEGRAELCSQLD
uniref:Uncharacterized protein n=1 Tax=Macrostomum lignano TaxID=282301 RepID=A0A1I8I056_9PLAT